VLWAACEGDYFVCTDFRKPGSQDAYYDIDFWVNQKTGKLEVDNVKTQSAGAGRRRVDASAVLHVR
jgi:hypothetical protein